MTAAFVSCLSRNAGFLEQILTKSEAGGGGAFAIFDQNAGPAKTQCTAGAVKVAVFYDDVLVGETCNAVIAGVEVAGAYQYVITPKQVYAVMSAIHGKVMYVDIF